MGTYVVDLKEEWDTAFSKRLQTLYMTNFLISYKSG